MDSGNEAIAAGNPTSRDEVLDVVLACAAEVAGEPMPADVDLLEAGFDSMKIVALATLIEERLGMPCSFDEVFDSANLDELATLMHGKSRSVAD